MMTSSTVEAPGKVDAVRRRRGTSIPLLWLGGTFTHWPLFVITRIG